MFNIVIVILSIYVLGALMVDTFFKLDREVSNLLDYIDNAICLIFFAEFVVNFMKAENKLRFMKWGWVDLLSSIPMVDLFRLGRLLRIVKILRILRAFRSLRYFLIAFYSNKKEGTIATALIFAIMILIFSSVAILQVENAPESNIKTAEDALWWAYTTITTVGYGDKYPVTTEGRIIAVCLMTTGVGLFGIFAGYIGNLLTNTKTKN
jgi:voltage-gated potassium channel